MRPGVANRPHIKTHKSPMLATLQVAAGARGITCQKLGEAEVMADAGHRRHPDQLQSDRRGKDGAARRAAGERASMTVVADNSTVVAGPAAGRAAAGPPAPVVVECDTGRERAGVETPGGGDRAGARDRGVNGLTLRGFHAVPDRDRLGRRAEVLR